MDEEIIDQFEAVADDGQTYTVSEFATLIPVRSLSSGTTYRHGARRLALSDGRHVNPVDGDDEAFRIFDTDELIRRVE